MRTRRPIPQLPAVLAACLFAAPASAQDAERAAHGGDAAAPLVSFEEEAGGVYVRQYQLGCLSQLTYLVVADGEACVVDPQRDVGHYVRDAAARKARIRYVALTHTNADFVAGHTELAAAGAEILISAESGSEFPHRAMKDGDRASLGRATLTFMATPGHTLDSATVLLTPAGAVAPAYAFTGDALFIGSIGRPDLAGGPITPTVLAGRAFDSVARFKALPDGVKVLPGHGAGSLCGAHLSPDTVSTIGREKATNPYFAIRGRAAFVAKTISGLPHVPAYFKRNVALNRMGPPVVARTDAAPPALTPDAFAARLTAGAWAIDLRDAADYAAGHVLGAVNVALRGRLDTWTGTVVPFDAEILLVGDDADVREAAFRLRRIGLDRVAGSLAGGMPAWKAAGRDVRVTPPMKPADLAARMRAGTEPIVVDVRTAEEFAELRLGDVALLPLDDPARFATVLDPAQETLFVCNSAYRSSMAVGLAERLGFTKVASLDGGLDAWITAGLPTLGTATVAGAVCAAPADAAAAPGAPFALPEPIEPRALAAALLDASASYAVFDVRPAAQIAEFALPGAVAVAPADVAARLEALPPHVRAVVVDRDGTTAFAVAGAALARTKNPALAIRVVVGGAARWWAEVELAGGAGGGGGGVAPPRPPSAGAPAPAAPPAAPKKRSAGC